MEMRGFQGQKKKKKKMASDYFSLIRASGGRSVDGKDFINAMCGKQKW